MALIDDIDGWSPRYHIIKRLDESWKIGEDEVLEAVMDTLVVLEELVDDYREHQARTTRAVYDPRDHAGLATVSPLSLHQYTNPPKEPTE